MRRGRDSTQRESGENKAWVLKYGGLSKQTNFLVLSAAESVISSL